MVEPRYRWALPATVDVPDALRAAAVDHELGTWALSLLVARGIADRDALDAFFAPAAAGLHDPRLLPDADRFVERIGRARDERQRVLVFGDFDADGLTGLAILAKALRLAGVDAQTYVPDRVEEGHGLSAGGIDAAAAAGASLIVTVDCGSSSVAEVEQARARGIDVIVTDHHRVPEVAPAALALVNPHRPDADYPDRRITGAGLAFKLAGLLLAGRGDKAGDDAAASAPRAGAELAALAAVGTVADVAPVLGENRAIVRLGLEAIRSGRSVGLAALLRRAGIEPAGTDLETIAFALAPRLNAAGRVGEAADAAALLMADDADEADRLAERLEGANLERRDLTRTAVAEARAAIPEVHREPATVIRGDWPAGIVGLVAARLAEEHGRPAVVGSNMGGTIRASCRGDGRLDLAAALGACDDLLTRYGGHRGAAGFEVAVERWDAFRERFLGLAATSVPPDPRVTLPVDLSIPAESLDYALLRDLARLAPYGPGHPDPLLAITGLTATRVRPATGGHTQLTLKRRLDVLDGIAFGRADLAETIQAGTAIDIVARLSSRRFGGFESLQLEVRDAADAGHISSLAGRDAAAAPATVEPGGDGRALTAVGPGRTGSVVGG